MTRSRPITFLASAAVIYVVARLIRKEQGIDLSRTFAQIPPD